MLPVIAIVGRPNVGKSTLFNYLTKTRAALVADEPGLTRDRLYGQGQFGEQQFIVIDTGGLDEDKQAMTTLMTQQVMLALAEADAILFMVDARAGLTAVDQTIVARLRRLQKPITLAVNKMDGINSDIAMAEFHTLGLGQPYAIAASHGRGIASVMTHICQAFVDRESPELESEAGIKLAIIGRPNVGKSTLVNRLLGEQRVITFDTPGTTRDSIFIPLEHQDQRYTLIDTAGVRRRSRVTQKVERFSVIKTLQAIKEAHVVIVVCNAQEGISEQDLHLLGFVLEAGRACIIAINKWDGLSAEQKNHICSELKRRLVFIDYAKQQFISALHGTGVGHLFASVKQAYRAATKKLSTPQLTRILQQALVAHPPPIVGRHRSKLRYAHQGGTNPPTIIIHGTKASELPKSYQRYLANTYRAQLHLTGTPVRLEFKVTKNPYADKKNKLTPRQLTKRKRMMKHVKRKS